MSKPFIPNCEFGERLEKVQAAMREEGLDLLLAYGNEAEPQFVRYFTNYWPSFETAGVLIPAEGKALLLIGPESGTFAADTSKIKEIRRLLAFRESSEPEYPGAVLDTFSSVIHEVMGGKIPKRVGIAGYALISKVIFDDFEAALREFAEIKIERADLLVSKIRAIKSDNELDCMREAYRICQLAMKNVVESIRPGITENQLKGIALSTIFAEGGEGEAYPFWILTGSDTNQAISRCRNKVVKEGDMIQIQVGARYEGYAATMGRPVVVGKSSEYQKGMIRAALTVQKELLDFIRPGVNAGDVSRLHQEVLDKLGYKGCILYGPCHGTGIMEGEYPWMELNSDYLLEKDMTFATCIYLGDDERGIGLRVEDGFRIADAGTESFSDYRREVIEV